MTWSPNGRFASKSDDSKTWKSRIGNLQWCSPNFQLNRKVLQPSYLREARELEAHIPPIGSTHGHYRSWKYELHTPTISGPTKNRFHLLKSLMVSYCKYKGKSSFWTKCENLQTPRNFDLVRKNGVPSGCITAKSLSHHDPSIRSQNLKRFGAV